MHYCYFIKTDIDLNFNQTGRQVLFTVEWSLLSLTAQFFVAGIGAFAASLSSGVRLFQLVVSPAVVSKKREKGREAKQPMNEATSGLNKQVCSLLTAGSTGRHRSRCHWDKRLCHNQLGWIGTRQPAEGGVEIYPHRLCQFEESSVPQSELYLRVVSHFFAIDGSHSVPKVVHLVVPELDGVTPAVVTAGHEQVLTAATGCSGRWGEKKVFEISSAKLSLIPITIQSR